MQHRGILFKIAEFVGDRCAMCNEGKAVAIKKGSDWDWTCLSCFQVLVSSTYGHDDYEVSHESSEQACDGSVLSGPASAVADMLSYNVESAVD